MVARRVPEAVVDTLKRSRRGEDRHVASRTALETIDRSLNLFRNSSG